MPDHRNIDWRKSSPLNIRILNFHTPPPEPERIPTTAINQGLVDMERDTHIRMYLDSQHDKPCPPSPLVQFPCSSWKSTVLPILDGCLEGMECIEKCKVSFKLGGRYQLQRALGLASKPALRARADWRRWRRRRKGRSEGGLAWDRV